MTTITLTLNTKPTSACGGIRVGSSCADDFDSPQIMYTYVCMYIYIYIYTYIHI